MTFRGMHCTYSADMANALNIIIKQTILAPPTNLEL